MSTPHRRTAIAVVAALTPFAGVLAGPHVAHAATTTGDASSTASSATSASSRAPIFTARSTSRFTAFTDANGVRWAARSATLGTSKGSSLLAGKDILGTTNDGIYQYGAPGVTGYRAAVPAGQYTVTLHFAEDYFTGAGKRVFDVNAEGGTVLAGVDIAKEVGKGAALDKSFTVDVTDGELTLGFVSKVDQATVSAIEVVGRPLPDSAPAPAPVPAPLPASAPAPSPSPAPEPVLSPKEPAAAPAPLPMPAPSPATSSVRRERFDYRMVARYATGVTDTAGRYWNPRTGTTGSGNASSLLVGKDVTGTEDDALFSYLAVGLSGYQLVVPGPGDYRVRVNMAEDYFTGAGKRVFDITAEGKTVAADVDIAKEVGKGAALTKTFTLTVTDGRLDLGFVKKVDNPVVASIEVVGQQEFGGAGPWDDSSRAVQFSPSSYFYQDISTAPVAIDNSEKVTQLVDQVGKYYNGIASFNAYDYNVALAKATPSTPTTTVQFVDCQNKGHVPDGLYNGPKYFVDVPIPDTAVPAHGTDGELSVYDPATDRLWEFWQAARTSTGGWQACWGGRIDNAGSSIGTFAKSFGVQATNTSAVGGMITLEDVRRGYINHAMSIAVVDAAPPTDISWPALRSDGSVGATSTLAEGSRFRLDPSVDVDKLNLTPIGRMVARAAQTYGFIIDNRAGCVTVATETGHEEKRLTGVNPWDGLLGPTPAYSVLKNFPWDKTQFLPRDYGKPVS